MTERRRARRRLPDLGPGKRAIIALLLLLPPALPLASANAGDSAPSAVEDRLREAITRSESLEVVTDDILGEGSGRWDPDPRYPDRRVNCIVWIKYLIAEAYGTTPDEKAAAMDAIRYFGSHVSWGTRIHYVDHWVRLDPGPLVPVQDPACVSDRRMSVRLDVAHFKDSHAYTCPIYGERDDAFAIEFMSRKATLHCARHLPEGLYVAFAIAKDRYIDLHGASSGPMGRVHGLIIDLSGPPGRNPSDTVVVHASTDAGRVSRVPLDEYVGRMRGIHQGYDFYRLDPAWQPSKSPVNAEMREILQCERTLGPTADLSATTGQ
jgi:hypothetical protein